MLINWLGILGAGQGYSGASENTVLALDKQGVDVRLMRFHNRVPKVNLSEATQRLFAKRFRLAKVGICFSFPNAFTSLMNDIKIGYTTFETDRIPNGLPIIGKDEKGNLKYGYNKWAGKTGNAVDIINKLDRLFVPCTHNKELFKNEGVTIPIDVVPHGVDLEKYHYIERPKKKVFTFLMLGTLTIRKNPGMVISAFLELFKNRDDVELILKTQSGTLGHIEFADVKNLKIIDRTATREEMQKLYQDADCFLFPSRGEGFGLPPLEAMATGLPTILSDNTGMSDFCDERYNFPVHCPRQDMRPAVRFPRSWGNVGNWYEPSFTHLKERMLYVFEHQDEAKKIGKDASEWIKSNWTFDNSAKKIISILEKNYGKEIYGKV